MASDVAITTDRLPNGTVKTAYSADIEASGGCTPYKWEITSGALPAGVSAEASSATTSLHLAGTPKTAASESFAVKVTGCAGAVSEAAYKVVIVEEEAANDSVVGITTTSLPNGKVKTAYSAAVEASGGCTPYKWEIASGALPAGVTAAVSSTTTSFNLTGTPTTAATDSFAVKVTGCGGAVSEVSYKVAIDASSTPDYVVDLSWSASTSGDVAGYNVYRGPNGTTWTKINSSLVSPTLYSDSTVTAGTTYYYATTAVNTSGEESSKSAPIEVAVP
jgi:large repetitive protein